VFLDLYPEINLQLVLANEELDLTMRQADCAVRLRQPQQPDLIQRRLFTVHLHVFAAQSYLDRHGRPLNGIASLAASVSGCIDNREAENCMAEKTASRTGLRVGPRRPFGRLRAAEQ
jgi:hypothetical protein